MYVNDHQVTADSSMTREEAYWYSRCLQAITVKKTDEKMLTSIGII